MSLLFGGENCLHLFGMHYDRRARRVTSRQSGLQEAENAAISVAGTKS
jgi:hypothetical protein